MNFPARKSEAEQFREQAWDFLSKDADLIERINDKIDLNEAPNEKCRKEFQIIKTALFMVRAEIAWRQCEIDELNEMGGF